MERNWKKTVWESATIKLSWDLGGGVDGYEIIRKEVQRHVQAMMPQLARDAIETIQRQSAEALKTLDTNGRDR